MTEQNDLRKLLIATRIVLYWADAANINNEDIEALRSAFTAIACKICGGKGYYEHGWDAGPCYWCEGDGLQNKLIEIERTYDEQKPRG